MYRIASVTPRGKVPINLASFVVVVGPNNAGKSQLLRDIALCANGRKEQAKVLENVDVDLGSSAIVFLKELVGRMKPDETGRYFLDGAGINLNETAQLQYDLSQFKYFIQSEDDARTHINATFTRELIAYLTTEARLTFSKLQTNLYRPNQPGTPSLVEALSQRGNAVERWLSERTRKAFDLEVALNYFDPGMLEMRVASRSSESRAADKDN